MQTEMVMVQNQKMGCFFPVGRTDFKLNEPILRG